MKKIIKFLTVFSILTGFTYASTDIKANENEISPKAAIITVDVDTYSDITYGISSDGSGPTITARVYFKGTYQKNQYGSISSVNISITVARIGGTANSSYQPYIAETNRTLNSGSITYNITLGAKNDSICTYYAIPPKVTKTV